MRRWLGLVVGIALAVIASKLLLEDLLGLSLEPWAAAWLDRPGVGSGVLILALLVADVVLPVPSSFVMVFSGAAFGVAAGSLLSLVGSIAGEWLGFALARRYGRGMAARLVGDGEIDRLSAFFARHGTTAVVMTRPLPIVMETISVVAGLSRMPTGRFLLASLLGTAPIVVLYAYAGAVSRQLGTVLPAIVILATMTGAGWMWYRAHRGATSPPSSEASSG